MISVSIIIVNYFSEKEILNCIKSIHSHNCNSVNYEVIVVSNSPFKDEYRSLLEKLGNVKIIQEHNNGGFSKGCNAGAAQAKGRFLLFLNPDTSFLNDVLFNLLSFHKSIESDAILAPLTYHPKDTLRPIAKNHLSLLTLLHEALPLIGLIIPDTMKSGHYKVSETCTVDVVQGSAIFISSDQFNKLGGMDERFFMYWEENDLCLRASKNRIQTLIIESAKIQHQGAVSTSREFIKMFLIQHASRKLFIAKHFPHLIGINRILAIFGYTWRAIGAFIIGDRKRTEQFYSVLKWYINSYDTEIISSFKT